MFANGCCGNINHGDYINGKRRSTLELGTALADATDAAWPGLKTVATFAPRVRSEQVTLQRRSYTPEQIANAETNDIPPPWRLACQMVVRDEDILVKF